MRTSGFSFLQDRARRGTISVVALMLCAIGTVGMLGMVSLMQARVAQVESMQEQTFRNVRERNGRQMAKEYAFQKVFTSSSGDEETVELPNGWGRITVPEWNRTAFTTTMRSSFYNHAGPGRNGQPFQLSLDVSIFDRLDPSSGDWLTASPRTLSTRLQSRAMANSGILLDARRQSPGRVIQGDLTVWGTAMIWQNADADDTFTFKAEQLCGYNDSVSKPNVSVGLAGGTGFLTPRNLPGLTLPTWFAPAGSALAPGAVPVIYGDSWAPFSSNPIAPSITEKAVALGAVTLTANTSYNRYGARCNGTGSMSVDLNMLNLPSLVLDGPLALTVTGQDSAAAMVSVENLAPIYLVIRNPALDTITFTGSNARPLVVAISSSGTQEVTLSFAAGSSYRVYLLIDNQPVLLSSAGTVTLQGGIATDHNLRVTQGSFQVRAETAHPEWFDQLLWRSFWVETYQNQL